MPVIQIVIALVVVGVLLWLTNTYLAKYMDGKISQILNAVVIFAVVLWLLFLSGFMQYPPVTAIVVIGACGFLLWLIETFVPMDNMFRVAIRIIVAIVLVLWIVSLFFPGAFSSMRGVSTMKIGKP